MSVGRGSVHALALTAGLLCPFTVEGHTACRYFDGQVVLAEYDPGPPATPTVCYFNGTTYLDEKLLLKQSSGDEFYYLLGHLYTVGGLTDAGGSLVEWYSYTGYGLPTIHTVTSSPGNPFFFTGQRLDRLDADALLVYDYKARVYDPLHGRFQQRDPSEFVDSYNLYEYALSRPSVLTDPSGQFSLPNISVSLGIRSGLFALNAYGRYQQVLSYVRQFKQGVELRQILLSMVVDAAIDQVGGRAFDWAIGAFGRVTARFATQAGRAVKAKIEAHHLIPKFLTGWKKKGGLFGLPDQLHDEFHRSLRENLKDAGIALPENAGPTAWADLLSDPEMFAKVREILLETTEEFDRARGLDMLPELIAEMERQGWL
jgi:RHS repeat-associated protein